MLSTLFRSFIFIGILFFFSHNAQALSEPFDHSLWDQFLKKYVNDEGQINFAAAQKETQLLDNYLDLVAALDSKKFPGEWPREEQLALWLNVYHASLIRRILQDYPLKNVHDIPDLWTFQSVTVAGIQYSLDAIKNNHLIASFRDEKIHTALYCGAKSCPKLQREAFTGARVEGQLYMAARRFVNDENKNQIIPGNKKLQLSKIFQWYAGDFKLDFGTFQNERGLSDEEFAVLSFLTNYLDDAKKIQYLEEGNYKIRYQDFDWSLNEWLPISQEASALPSSN